MRIRPFAALLVCLVSLQVIPASACSADTSRYFVIPGSRSPKGTYVLGFEVPGRAKVDWSRLTNSVQNQAYMDAVLGPERDQARCYLFRRKDMRPIKRITNLPFYPSWRRLGEPAITWSKQEDAFFVSFLGYWETSFSDITTVAGKPPADHADLLPLIKQALERYRRLHTAEFARKQGLYYKYTFEPTIATFTTRNRISLKLHLYVPKGSSDWEAYIRLNIRLGRPGRSLRASVESVKLLSLHPETPE